MYFGQKTKVKRYSVILKDSKNKPLKNTWVSLKIKDKVFKAKTSDEGRATFKITNLYKKGKFTAKTIFKGNKFYSASSKIIKITVR